MPATIYQGGFATDTIQAGNVMTITSSGSALVERFDGQDAIDKNSVSGAKTFGPYLRQTQVRITALSGNVTYSQGKAGENVLAQLATDAGVTVGLSGGSPAAGVPFGPPSTIFRLRMRCTGGAATVTVTATKRSGGGDTFNFSLASGGDVSEPMYADDYSSLLWNKTGAGSVTLEVI